MTDYYKIHRNTDSGLMFVTEFSGDDWDANREFYKALERSEHPNSFYHLTMIQKSGTSTHIKAERPCDWAEERKKISDENKNGTESTS